MNVSQIAVDCLIGLGVFGIITSTIYSLMVVAGVIRFQRGAGDVQEAAFLPPVSVLKAVHGDEPDLEAKPCQFFRTGLSGVSKFCSARGRRTTWAWQQRGGWWRGIRR